MTRRLSGIQGSESALISCHSLNFTVAVAGPPIGPRPRIDLSAALRLRRRRHSATSLEPALAARLGRAATLSATRGCAAFPDITRFKLLRRMATAGSRRKLRVRQARMWRCHHRPRCQHPRRARSHIYGPGSATLSVLDHMRVEFWSDIAFVLHFLVNLTRTDFVTLHRI